MPRDQRQSSANESAQDGITGETAATGAPLEALGAAIADNGPGPDRRRGDPGGPRARRPRQAPRAAMRPRSAIVAAVLAAAIAGCGGSDEAERSTVPAVRLVLRRRPAGSAGRARSGADGERRAGELPRADGLGHDRRGAGRIQVGAYDDLIGQLARAGLEPAPFLFGTPSIYAEALEPAPHLERRSPRRLGRLPARRRRSATGRAASSGRRSSPIPTPTSIRGRSGPGRSGTSRTRRSSGAPTLIPTNTRTSWSARQRCCRRSIPRPRS